MNPAIPAVDTVLIRSGLLLIGALQVTWSCLEDKSLAITLTKGSHFAYINIRFNTTKKMDAGWVTFMEEQAIQQSALNG